LAMSQPGTWSIQPDVVRSDGFDLITTFHVILTGGSWTRRTGITSRSWCAPLLMIGGARLVFPPEEETVEGVTARW